jgi:hypothetical protein
MLKEEIIASKPAMSGNSCFAAGRERSRKANAELLLAVLPLLPAAGGEAGRRGPG